MLLQLSGLILAYMLAVAAYFGYEHITKVPKHTFQTVGIVQTIDCTCCRIEGEIIKSNDNNTTVAYYWIIKDTFVFFVLRN